MLRLVKHQGSDCVTEHTQAIGTAATSALCPMSFSFDGRSCLTARSSTHDGSGIALAGSRFLLYQHNSLQQSDAQLSPAVQLDI